MTGFEDLADRVAGHVEPRIAAMVGGGTTAIAVRTSDNVRVKTGHNRASTTTSTGVPVFHDPGPADSHPAPSRAELEVEPSYGEAGFVTQSAPHSGHRERKDGAVAQAIGEVAADWKGIGERACRRVSRG